MLEKSKGTLEHLNYVIVIPWLVRPVRGDNPRALASGLFYVQVDKHGITNYTTYISEDLAHHELFRA